jgi:hypothetical protein
MESYFYEISMIWRRKLGWFIVFVVVYRSENLLEVPRRTAYYVVIEDEPVPTIKR